MEALVVALLTRDNTVGSEMIYEGRIISLRVDTVAFPDGRPVTRETVEHNGGVVIAAQPSANEVILIKQYRYSVDELLIELPAGRIEIGEDPFDCAKREITEETGYLARNWSELARMYSAPGFCSEML
jgi:ADP-ribose pyrophosphatase